MKIKTAFCFLYAFVSFMHSNAQQPAFNCDSADNAVFRKYKGEIVEVKCDTIYLLNKSTFNSMYSAYNDFRSQNLLLNQYTLQNDSISDLYEAQLDTQKQYFDTLNTYFDNLNKSADQIIKKSTANMESISSNLDAINFQVKEATVDLNNTKMEIRKAKQQKLKWGAIGFGAGIVATFITILILGSP